MKTKILIGAALVAALVAVMFFLRSTTGGESVRAGSVTLPKNVLKLEGDPWSGYITMRDQKFKQALSAQGYDYSYKEELDQTKRANHMTEGSIDFMVTTLGQYLKHRPTGQVVGMIDESRGADALVLNTRQYPYLKSVDQLPKLVREYKKQGKKPVLAYTGDSPSEELLMALSNGFDELKLSDFNLQSVDESATALKKLQSNEAQVAVIWEPDTSAAKSAGYTVALSKDVPRRILDIIVASDRVIKTNPQAVQAFVSEFYRERAWNASHGAEFQDAIAKDSSPQLKPEEDRSVLDGIYLFDAAASEQFLNVRAYPLDQSPIWESVSGIAGILALSDPTMKVSDKMWNGRFVHQSISDLR